MTRWQHTIIVRPDAEQGGYWVEVPALPGVYSQGDTLEEAIANGREAITGYIESLRLAGEPVPEEQEPVQAIQVMVAA